MLVHAPFPHARYRSVPRFDSVRDRTELLICRSRLSGRSLGRKRLVSMSSSISCVGCWRRVRRGYRSVRALRRCRRSGNCAHRSREQGACGASRHRCRQSDSSRQPTESALFSTQWCSVQCHRRRQPDRRTDRAACGCWSIAASPRAGLRGGSFGCRWRCGIVLPACGSTSERSLFGLWQTVTL